MSKSEEALSLEELARKKRQAGSDSTKPNISKRLRDELRNSDDDMSVGKKKSPDYCVETENAEIIESEEDLLNYFFLDLKEFEIVLKETCEDGEFRQNIMLDLETVLNKPIKTFDEVMAIVKVSNLGLSQKKYVIKALQRKNKLTQIEEKRVAIASKLNVDADKISLQDVWILKYPNWNSSDKKTIRGCLRKTSPWILDLFDEKILLNAAERKVNALAEEFGLNRSLVESILAIIPEANIGECLKDKRLCDNIMELLRMNGKLDAAEDLNTIFYIGKLSEGEKVLKKITPSTALSTITKISNRRNCDFHIHRPFNEPRSNPVVLYVEEFNGFYSRLQEPLPKGFDQIVAIFADVMCTWYKNEKERQNALGNWFDKNLCIPGIEVTIAGVGEAKSDLQFQTRNGKKVADCEVKNEFGDGGGDCSGQLLCYTLKREKSDINRPMFVFVVAGASFRIGGAVRNPVTTIDYFTPMLSCDKNGIKDTRFLIEIGHCLHALKMGIADLAFNSELDQEVDYTFPFFKIANSNFCYKYQLFPQKLLYEATVDDQKCIVKFSLSYGVDVHKFCFENGFAPKLVHHEQLASGWQVIVMEYIDVSETVPKRSQVEEKLKILHNHNFVHGDIRPDNVVLRDGKVVFLDFDWAGINGTPIYPCFLNNQLRWHDTAYAGQYVKKEHDLYRLDYFSEM